MPRVDWTSTWNPRRASSEPMIDPRPSRPYGVHQDRRTRPQRAGRPVQVGEQDDTVGERDPQVTLAHVRLVGTESEPAVDQSLRERGHDTSPRPPLRTPSIVGEPGCTDRAWPVTVMR